jgi:predicted Zn-dependent peptidase
VGVLVGDFEAEAAKPVLREYFGRLQRGAQDPPPVVTLEVRQAAEKRLYGECDCPPQIEVRYHTVPFNHRDSFALQIMAEILNGRTGRLYKSMIEGSEIASSAYAGQDSRKYAGYFAFTGESKGEAAPEELEQAWYGELGRLQNEPVSGQELQKVKNQIAADSYRRLQSNGRLLFQLALYEASGGWRYINEGPAKLTAVTAEDIMRVANTYFSRSNRCVAIYTRRAGEAEGEEDPLAGLPPPIRSQFQQTLERLLSYDDPDELRQVVERLEMGAAQAPADIKPAMEYMLDRLREHLAGLDAEADR